MATVRFTTTCDVLALPNAATCGRRAHEYTAWPSCRECLNDVCPTHAELGTWRSGEGEGPNTVLCVACAALERLR